MKTFENFNIKNLNFRNRIVMPPMCMYSADESGKVNDFHFVHYVTRAIGGVGLIILESTGVSPNGRITDGDLGIWSDDHIEGLKKLVNGVKNNGAAIAVQLNHGGRKYEGTSGDLLAPSAIRHSSEYRNPKELTKEQIKDIVESFKNAAGRADAAGFDAIEIHGAHGYLIHEFLSPLTNKREDEYGGNTENRTRFLKDIIKEIKTVWPKEKAILFRVSAYDYTEGGLTGDEMVKIINLVKNDIDIVHVSTGGLLEARIHSYPGYQVKFSEQIKKECNVPTITVGLITGKDMVEEILQNNRADLVALGRELLRNPYWVLNTMKNSRVENKFPKQYSMI